MDRRSPARALELAGLPAREPEESQVQALERQAELWVQPSGAVQPACRQKDHRSWVVSLGRAPAKGRAA